MSNEPSTIRSKAVDAAATLGVLVVGAWVLALAAPLVSALAVMLTAGLYIPMRLLATPAGVLPAPSVSMPHAHNDPS